MSGPILPGDTCLAIGWVAGIAHALEKYSLIDAEAGGNRREHVAEYLALREVRRRSRVIAGLRAEEDPVHARRRVRPNDLNGDELTPEIRNWLRREVETQKKRILPYEDFFKGVDLMLEDGTLLQQD